MVSSQVLLSQLVVGIAIASIYLILSLGLTVIFGMMGIVNFAHGELYALGAYMGFTIISATSNFWVALLIAPLIVGVIGVVIEVTTIRRLYDEDPILALLLTFGIALVLTESIKLVWGTSSKPFATPELLAGPVSVAGVFFPKYWLFVITFTGAVTMLSILALEKTKYGLYVRAAYHDRDMVMLLGIDKDKLYTGVFGFGAALAGLAGVVVGPLRGVNPVMGTEIIVTAFVIVVVGGLGSIRGAVIGSLLIGVGVTLSKLFINQWSALIMFVIMGVVLLTKPEGLMGETGRVE